ncbi:MAG: sugar transferase [Janthinobacterium lividum]
MSEEMMPIFGTVNSLAEAETTAAVAHPKPATHARPSPLAKKLCSSKMQLLDKIAVVTAFALTLFDTPLHQGQTLFSYLEARVCMRNLLIGTALLLAWRIAYWALGMYQANLNYRAALLLWKVPTAALFCAAPAFPLLRYTEPTGGSYRTALLFWFFTCTLLLIVRAGVLTYEEQIRPAFRKPRTAVICGTGPIARLKATELAGNSKYRYQLLGFVDNNPHNASDLAGPVLCGVKDLEQLLMHQPIDEVIIGLPLKSRFGEVEEIVAICGRAGVQMQYSLDLFNTEVAKSRNIDDEQNHQVVLEMVHHDHRILLKNVVDRTLAGAGLMILWPLFAVIGLAIKFASPGPVFFVQQRFGLNKRRFGMIKFRSMVVDAEARQAALEHMNENGGPTFKMKRDPRVTRVGAFLRSTSLDELPQLINVLKGEMSLVGPRPLPTRDVQRFSEPWLMRRFSVKPGITGLWQVSGRSNTDFDNAIKLDLRYIDRWSLLMDLRILLRTVSAVIKRSGAY